MAGMLRNLPRSLQVPSLRHPTTLIRDRQKRSLLLPRRSGEDAWRSGGDAAPSGLRLAAVAALDRGQVAVVPDPAGPVAEHVPAALIAYVHARRKAVRGDAADLPASVVDDPYLRRHRPRTVLATPIVREDQLMAVLYLEHRLLPASFTPEYLELLDVLCAQAAIALENATVHARLLEVNRILDATFDRLPVAPDTS